MTMAARTNWKVLTVGAALAGLGITGAGIAMADSDGSESSQIKPIEVSAAQEPAARRRQGRPGADDLGGKAVDDTADTPDDANDSPDNTPDDDTLTTRRTTSTTRPTTDDADDTARHPDTERQA